MVFNAPTTGVDADMVPQVSEGFLRKWRSVSLRGKGRADAENDAHLQAMLDIPVVPLSSPLLATGANANAAWKVQVSAQSGGEQISNSPSLSGTIMSAPLLASPLSSVSGVDSTQSDEGQYKEEREMDNIKRPLPTMESFSPCSPSASLSLASISSLCIFSPSPLSVMQDTTEDIIMKNCVHSPRPFPFCQPMSVKNNGSHLSDWSNLF